jgi:hypothetical protein
MKEAYYFSHDANARHDPKILAMRSVYGTEGYGWYWIVVEMLREQENYKIKIGKYTWNALAMQMQCNADTAHKFVSDCIEEFELLHSDNEYFWSNSLLKRMNKKNEKSEKARKAAAARWGKKAKDKGKNNDSNKENSKENSSNADAMQTHSESNALNESKVNESKVKESKVKDITTIEDDTEEINEDEKQNPVADVDADSIQQEEDDLAILNNAVEEKPLEKIENEYKKIISKNTIGANDLKEIVQVFEKYKDVEFIIKCIKQASENNKRKYGRNTIKSFSYITTVIDDEYKKLQLRQKAVNVIPIKGGENHGSNNGENGQQRNFGF